MLGDYLDPVSMLRSQAALKRDRPRRFTLAGAAINSLDLVALASREGFGGL